jgi:hypothetical protein
MEQADLIQTEAQRSARGKDVPEHVDAFLKALARWVVEDMQNIP